MQIQNAAITGSFEYNGVDISSITGSTSNITSLNAITASILSTTASLNTASGSAITRLSALEVTSGSNITRISALETASGSAITRLGALEVTSGSNITRIGALETASGSAITRLSSIESKTGSYATTGSNTFVDGQYLSSSFNPTGFSTTASLYTDGGLRVTRDAYISGTLYLNNVTVFGTQSVAYISSSQLNIGTNLITVNTDTPSIRFGGLAVYDSGSTGLTGSILWDSETNHWIYSNPSGSSYSGGMFISGPRTSTLGSETGTTSCMLLAGQGGDHLTSSMIYHSSTVTCIPNTLIGSTVCTTMANASCIGINTTTPFKRLTIDASEVSSDGIAVRGNSSPAYILCETSGVGSTFTNDSAAGYIGTITNHPFNINSNSQNRLTFSSAGVACFACQVCAPRLEILRSSANNGLFVYSNSGATAIGCTMAQINGLTNDSTGNILTLASLNDGIRAVFRNDGNVGIGTTLPVAKLDIVSTGEGSEGLRVDGATGGFAFVVRGGSTYTSHIRAGATIGANYFTTPPSNGLIVEGNVGIGATAPSSLLHICGAGTGVMLRLQNTSTVSSDQGPLIQFMSANQVGGQNFESGYIQSIWTNEGNGFGMRFATKGVDASQSEKMRITSGGVVQIGGSATPALASKLFISRGDQYGLHINVVSGTVSMIASDDNMTLGTSGTERMRITSTGIACFACQVCAPSFRTNGGFYGCVFQGVGFSTLTGGSGTGNAIFNTVTRSGAALYEVAIVANPNGAGSGAYADFYYGDLLIGTGFDGGVKDYIFWCQRSTPPRSLYGSGGGNLTVNVCMFYSGAEYSNISLGGTYTIRFKINGYNSSATGDGTTIFLKQII